MKKIITRLAVSFLVSVDTLRLVSSMQKDRSGKLTPCTHGEKTCRDESTLGASEKDSSSEKGSVTGLKGLKGTDEAKSHDLAAQPLSRSKFVEKHIGRNFKYYNSQRKHLLANVVLILGDTDVGKLMPCHATMVNDVYPFDSPELTKLSVRAFAMFPLSSSA